MALANFRILIHELLNKVIEIVPQESPLIILDGNSAVCVNNDGKDTKHTRNISRRVNYVGNGLK